MATAAARNLPPIAELLATRDALLAAADA